MNSKTIISAGFGSLTKEFKIGSVIGESKRCYIVLFKDEDGEYKEHYDKRTGIRNKDLRSKNGFRINLKDLQHVFQQDDFEHAPKNERLEINKNEKVSRFKKVFKKKISMKKIDEGSSVVVLEIWYDSVTDKEYVKTYTEAYNEKTKRKKQVPAMVPYYVVLEYLFAYRYIGGKKNVK